MQAFLPTIGYTEIAALLVLGVVLFGRDLPDVGRRLGKVVNNLRRGLHDFKRQLDQDENLREIREDMHKTRRDLHDATAIPRGLKNPGGALRNLASEAMEPLPEEQDSEHLDANPEPETATETGTEPEEQPNLPPGTPRSDAQD
ncbi:MAG: twin-arginine translocase TatA/TatE family subunit [Planctomycetota bacterium]|nr:twin-arginine translocase TatA/TatE family subunit [Planctomycetota bacterium]